MRTRQSTANITHHDATHTFFIYMTTKTALNVQRQKQNIVTHWKYSLSWLPAFISCSSPLLDIVLEFSVSSSNFFLKYLYTKFNKSIVAFFFLSRLLPFATPWNGLNNAHVFWSSPFRYCEWIYWFLLFTLECLSNTNKFNNIG